MSTYLFLDVENMGSKQVRKAVDAAVKKYSPDRKEMILSTTSNIPQAFKGLAGWIVRRCQPGKDAADHLIQSRMVNVAKESDVDRIILVTSDHGFVGACKKVLAAGKHLLLIVNKAKRLLRAMTCEIGANVSFINIAEGNRMHDACQQSVFVKDWDNQLVEIPFCNGMAIDDFCQVLRDMGLYRKHVCRWISEFFLVVKANRVFVDHDGILASA